MNRDDLATIGITIVAVVLLTLLFRYTALGLRMRAVVESPRMTELAGIDADRVSMASWMLCSILAGLAGVLLAPLFAAVSEFNYTTLVVVAMSAAVLAGLTNIPVAFIGGLLLGVVGEVVDAYLPTNSVIASNLRPALPFLVLFLVLILSPSLRNRRELADPLAGVDPPPPPPAAAVRSRFLTNGTRVFGVLVGLFAGYYIFFHAASNWRDVAITATILATIFLSITVITGMAGEICLCISTFAAIGACTTAQLATRFGMSVLAGDVGRWAHRGRRRRAARAPVAAAGRHLLLARDLRVRLVLRERHGEVRLGRRRPAPGTGAEADRSGRSTSTRRATRASSSCVSSSW